jgi:hypothetical protein
MDNYDPPILCCICFQPMSFPRAVQDKEGKQRLLHKCDQCSWYFDEFSGYFCLKSGEKQIPQDQPSCEVDAQPMYLGKREGVRRVFYCTEDHPKRSKIL